ncbi:MAG: hypothetical protein O4804_11340 [Trichodesmium sp. St11_bin5]|nr:hypothetical protein [Trichodesmium sp. St11_bin5]
MNNDEYREVDYPAVVASIVRNRAFIVIFGSANELENFGIFESGVLNDYWAQDFQATVLGWANSNL